jgi:pimeloyl-ACP methyl ester carboxylesterase
LFILLLVSLLSGCAGFRQETRSAAPPCDCDSRGVIFVADGAGNTGGCSAAFRQAVADDQLPLCVEMFDWSYGPYRYLADEMDYPHAREGGQCLAARVAAYRQVYPDRPVYLAGHSAGCAVILAAAEGLTPGSVEDIALLAPAVSTHYDLRPALRCSRHGIDVFCSERDWAVLGLGVSIVGTTDRHWSAPAGRLGFQPMVAGPADAALYGKLREHPWQPSVAWTGNRGGHFDSYEQSCYLRAYVLPALLAPALR